MDTKSPPTTTCHGLTCNCADLIEAHIIPKGFGRFVRDDTRNIALSLVNADYAKPPLGQYDDQILCSACDNQLGVFDNYAIQICKTFSKNHRVIHEGVFELPNVDGDKFAKSLLAILWRASISSRPDYTDVLLGLYEDIARDVLFGALPLESFKEYRVMVQRYASKHFDVEGFYSLPVRGLIGGRNAYSFSLAGFRVTAKLDAMPWPAQWESFITNGKDALRGFFVEIEATPEFERIASMVVADHFRQLAKKPGM